MSRNSLPLASAACAVSSFLHDTESLGRLCVLLTFERGTKDGKSPTAASCTAFQPPLHTAAWRLHEGRTLPVHYCVPQCPRQPLVLSRCSGNKYLLDNELHSIYSFLRDRKNLFLKHDCPQHKLAAGKYGLALGIGRFYFFLPHKDKPLCRLALIWELSTLFSIISMCWNEMIFNHKI